MAGYGNVGGRTVDDDRLSLRIALDTLRHLGMNLYSSLPPVLSELVANSYDARARRVEITLSDEQVVIADDGIGMDRADVQEKYLVVGRDRRVDDPTGDVDPYPDWPRRDKPMGRKGIGKLAMFSIADDVEVVSVKDGRPVGFRMQRSAIEEAAQQREDYYPVEIDPPGTLGRGTRVTLGALRRKRAISREQVLKSLARRFSVIDLDDDGDGLEADNEFSVYVDGTRVGLEHWDVFPKLQYFWALGQQVPKTRSACSPDCRVFDVAATVDLGDGVSSDVSGWIGTVHRPEQLKSRAGGMEINDNRIVVDCRGKVAISNFLHQFGESGVYASYLTGYVRADFLDDAEDIATSDRERMQEDDPRVAALRRFVRQLLKTIQKQWTELRRQTAADEATKDPSIGPIVEEWLDGLSEDERVYARHLLGRLGSARFAADEDRAQVLKYGIMAFERLRVRQRLHVLREASDDRLAAIATMFALESDLENALYADIASQRLGVVRELEQLTDAQAKEKLVQKFIYEHLWLLEPSWTIQDQLSSRLEQRVASEFKSVDLTDDERRGRVDIRYRKSGGIHVIIELKKPDVSRTVYQLLDQVKKYRSALRKCLLEVEGDSHPIVQCVCLVGRLPQAGEEEQGALDSAGTKIRTYDQVISDSCKRFADYMEAQARFSRLQEIFARLDAIDVQSAESSSGAGEVAPA